jgi:hypothetical protein
MPHFKVAHIREQGQNMLIFPLDSSVHHKTDAEKAEILDELEMRAHAAGLAGGAVVVWEHGRSFNFMGPRPWHPFLRSIDMGAVMASVNKEIRW